MNFAKLKSEFSYVHLLDVLFVKLRGRDGHWKLSIALLFLGRLIANAFLETNGEVLVLEIPFITTQATINQFQK